MFDFRLLTSARLMGTMLLLPVATAGADCPCRQAATAAVVVSQVDPGGLPQAPLPPSPENGLPPAPSPAPEVPPSPGPARGPTPQTAAPPSPATVPATGLNRFGVAPPPGTLGRTYQRRTTLIPDEKHPRIGIVDVHLPENVDVTARGMKSKWTGEVWQLETEAPLLPGTPHIYAIKAEKTLPNGQREVDVRWVRLIMGRVVDLEF